MFFGSVVILNQTKPLQNKRAMVSTNVIQTANTIFWITKVKYGDVPTDPPRK